MKNYKKYEMIKELNIEGKIYKVITCIKDSVFLNFFIEVEGEESWWKLDINEIKKYGVF